MCGTIGQTFQGKLKKSDQSYFIKMAADAAERKGMM
jgi:hypothetical protein